MRGKLLGPGVAVAALLAAAGLPDKADAISVELDYGGTNVTLNDGASGDQNGNTGTVEYIEGPSGNNFGDFSNLILQGSLCSFCPSRITLESEVAFGATTAQDDLTLRVSDTGFTLNSALTWLAKSDFTSIFGSETSADYTTYWDATNQLFGTPASGLIDTDTLTDTDSSSFLSSIGTPSSPFSLTVEVVFPADELQASTQTLDATAQLRMSEVPVPASVLLMLPALAGLGFLGRRRRAA